MGTHVGIRACVGMGTHVDMGTCVGMGTCVVHLRRQENNLKFQPVLRDLLPSFGTECLTSLELCWSRSFQDPAVSCLPSHVLRLRCEPLCPVCYAGSEDPNSGTHAWEVLP